MARSRRPNELTGKWLNGSMVDSGAEVTLSGVEAPAETSERSDSQHIGFAPRAIILPSWSLSCFFGVRKNVAPLGPCQVGLKLLCEC